MAEHRSFLPAAGHDLFLPLYDPIQRLLGGDAARDELLAEATLEPGMRVLDIGCGTGSFAVQILIAAPGVQVVGIDPDPKALARAERKLAQAGLSAHLDQGYADALPYPVHSFDRVFSTFMFHHLDADAKAKTLREALRVLRPGGRLHLLDFGGSQARPSGLLARLLHSGETLRDNYGGRVPALMADSGFAEAAESGSRRTLFGPVARYRALAPAA